MRKRLEERRRFTETVLNGLSAGLITTDGAGEVSFANRAALATLGLSLAGLPRAAGGRDLRQQRGRRRAVVAAAAERGEARLDFPVISPGGAGSTWACRSFGSLRAAGGADLRLPLPQPRRDAGERRPRRAGARTRSPPRASSAPRASRGGVPVGPATATPGAEDRGGAASARSRPPILRGQRRSSRRPPSWPGTPRGRASGCDRSAGRPARGTRRPRAGGGRPRAPPGQRGAARAGALGRVRCDWPRRGPG